MAILRLKSPKYAIEAKGLDKTYKAKSGDVHALKSVDLKIPTGSIFGLLGPNGAGKSTFINIMAGLVIKSAGEMKVWHFDIDKDPRQARAAIGVVPQEINLDAFLTPIDALDIQAGLFGLRKNERRSHELLEILGLSDKAEARARSLSGGMRRRLMVAKAMVHSPPILVLDEPTAGVDVDLRRQLWDYVKKLNDQGVTILLTTHYLEEAEALCDEIAIINHGELIAHDSTRNLVRRLDRKVLLLTLSDKVKSIPKALKEYGVEQLDSHTIKLYYRPSKKNMQDILDIVCDAGLRVIDLSTEEADLEDIFLHLTKKQQQKAAA